MDPYLSDESDENIVQSDPEPAGRRARKNAGILNERRHKTSEAQERQQHKRQQQREKQENQFYQQSKRQQLQQQQQQQQRQQKQQYQEQQQQYQQQQRHEQQRHVQQQRHEQQRHDQQQRLEQHRLEQQRLEQQQRDEQKQQQHRQKISILGNFGQRAVDTVPPNRGVQVVGTGFGATAERYNQTPRSIIQSAFGHSSGGAAARSTIPRRQTTFDHDRYDRNNRYNRNGFQSILGGGGVKPWLRTHDVFDDTPYSPNFRGVQITHGGYRRH